MIVAGVMPASWQSLMVPSRSGGAGLAGRTVPSGGGRVHFGVIETDGYRFLEVGDQVEFDYEPAQPDSFRFVATRVRKL